MIDRVLGSLCIVGWKDAYHHEMTKWILNRMIIRMIILLVMKRVIGNDYYSLMV